MKEIEIKSIIGDLLFTHKCEDNTIKKTVEQAVKMGANLYSADLQDANLHKADLSGADLRGTNLRGADLSVREFSKSISLKEQNQKAIALKVTNYDEVRILIECAEKLKNTGCSVTEKIIKNVLKTRL